MPADRRQVSVSPLKTSKHLFPPLDARCWPGGSRRRRVGAAIAVSLPRRSPAVDPPRPLVGGVAGAAVAAPGGLALNEVCRALTSVCPAAGPAGNFAAPKRWKALRW